MRAFPLTFYSAGLVLAALFALSCSSISHSNTDRTLQSITLGPATTDAKDYPGGQVQFTATGHYNMDPETVVPLSAAWGTCFEGESTSAISVSSTGLAQCASGTSGTFTVWADDFPQS